MQTRSCILLAAGQSSRMGFPKALGKVGTRTLLEQQLLSLNLLGLRPIVVLGHHEKAIRETIPNLSQMAEIVENSHPENGQFSSLLCGLKTAEPGPVFLLPLDTPCPERGVWESLDGALSHHAVVIPSYSKKGGHPILLAASFRNQVVHQTDPQARLDWMIRDLPALLVERLDLHSPEVLLDLDTPEDWSHYLANQSS